MEVAGGRTESGIVVGNVYDKYGSRNPIVRRLMAGFERSLSDLVANVDPRTIHEVGCGEGHWIFEWLAQGYEARGTDFSSTVINIARRRAQAENVDPARFQVLDIYDLEARRDGADLIVCCEVLEHLPDPDRALRALSLVAPQNLVLSVLREPIWRVLNMARGRYLRRLGNTPGHLQNWSSTAFVNLIRRHFDVVEVRNPLPWTMVHCRSKAA